MDVLGENCFLLLEQIGGVSDIEFLQRLCERCGLHLYVEENRRGTNYMLSGNAFVLDIFYRKEESLQVNDSWLVSDNQSIESSVVQVGKEKIEDVPLRKVDRVSLSLLDESWSVYFQIFTQQVYLYLRHKEYTKLYELVCNVAKYDRECQEGRENKGFGTFVEQAKQLEKTLGKKEGEVNYCVATHTHCVLWSSPDAESYPVYAAIAGKKKNVSFLGENKSLAEVERVVEVLRENPLLWRVVAESLLFGIGPLVSLTLQSVPSGLVFCEMGPPKKHVLIQNNGYVLVGDTPSSYQFHSDRSLLIKRTHSIWYLIKEEGIVVG
ncbi:hypothetical protein NEHOM01_0150 [Nematocida homosporus]|uniref:uncharacterized protein n=1 Tax=Nematocida homosporus TaxID=1912981 RepID=UPI00221E6B12|nr:uncharacterized protein NEHOM01_0150 [Nematocida homosporus]KAI5184405.1 hypothetical protein NEHOM01_0150 [Nematocida homosporus]